MGTKERLDNPMNFGTLITRLMITEKEPLVSNEYGMTIGQLVDKHFDAMRERFNDPNVPAEHRPAIHSITIELPQEERL